MTPPALSAAAGSDGSRRADPVVLLGFRDAAHALAATLSAIRPSPPTTAAPATTGVTDLLVQRLGETTSPHVYACGPPAMLEAAPRPGTGRIYEPRSARAGPAARPADRQRHGLSRDEVARLVAAFSAREEVAALELNVSCPNVETGLLILSDTGQRLPLPGRRAARGGGAPARRAALTDKPMIVKLTPNASDVPAVARAAETEGADAVSLINTLRGMALDPLTGRGSPAAPAAYPGRPAAGRRPPGGGGHRELS